MVKDYNEKRRALSPVLSHRYCNGTIHLGLKVKSPYWLTDVQDTIASFMPTVLRANDALSLALFASDTL